MANILDIKRRIRSVTNTRQITKAMKMVSAAKLRRAQERVIASRPYAKMLREMLANVASVASSEEIGDNPLLAVRERKNVLLIVITADRGLAGGFNGNLIKKAVAFTREHTEWSFTFELVGRKCRDFFRRRYKNISGEMVGIFMKSPTYDNAKELATRVTEAYAEGKYDAVFVAVNEFKSVMAPNIAVNQLLPMEVPDGGDRVDYIYEQPPKDLLGKLVPRYVETTLYRSLLESAAAEHASRMTAMDAASSNASDVIDSLTLYMNRVRQAAITKEIIEIVSGAAALE